MSFGTALTIAGVALLLAFIGFAFRQGARVKRDRNARDHGQLTEPGHHGIDGHGGHGGGH